MGYFVLFFVKEKIARYQCTPKRKTSKHGRKGERRIKQTRVLKAFLFPCYLEINTATVRAS